MTIQTDDNGFKWVANPKDCMPEYTPIRCFSLLNFFTLSNRKSVISKENLIPLTDAQYLIRAKSEEKYYLHTYRNWDIDTLYFYYSRQGNDIPEVENLRRYVYDGNVTLLFTPQMVDDMRAMLARIYKAQFKSEGTLEYKIFISLLRECIEYEEYKEYGKGLTGFRTVCNQFDVRIGELWKAAKK